MLDQHWTRSLFRATPILGTSPTLPRWIRYCASPWWYVAIIAQIVIVRMKAVQVHYILDSIVLLVGIGLFLTPAFLYPRSLMARGWRIIALSWFILFLRQFYLIFDYQEPRPAWLDLFLVGIYVPGLIIVGRIFYRLPFQRRSRTSLFIECLAIGIALTLTAATAFDIPPQHFVFVSGNLMILYAVTIIYQQSREDWRDSFRAARTGLTALIFSDVVWVWLLKQNMPLLYNAPLYTWAWILFARSVLFIRPSTPDYNPNQIIVSPLQDNIGLIVLLGCVCIMVWFDVASQPIFVLIALIILVRLIESTEYGRLYKKIDQARRSEGRLRFFVQNLSHALKTPLNGIAVWLMNHQVTDNEIFQHYQALQRRITFLLDLSRVMQNTVKLKTIAIQQLEPDIQNVWKTLRKAYPNSIRFTIQPYDHHTTVAIDYTIFLHMLEDIFVNALHAQRQQSNGAVIVTIAADGESTMLYIDDHGKGFPAAILSGLYASHRDDAYSSGLGLSSVVTLAQEMGGICELSNTDHGARVTFIFRSVA